MGMGRSGPPAFTAPDTVVLSRVVRLPDDLRGALARAVDSEAMDSADENNPHRILRILEVWQGTGRKLSEWKKEREGGIGEIPVYYY